MHLIERKSLTEKQSKERTGKNLLLIHHSALNNVNEILTKDHRHILNSVRLSASLPSPPRIVFQHLKMLENRLERSKSKRSSKEKSEIYNSEQPSCEFRNFLKLSSGVSKVPAK